VKNKGEEQMETEIHLSADKMAVTLNGWFKYKKHSLGRTKTNIVSHLH
jgi:hypothetical protein